MIKLSIHLAKLFTVLGTVLLLTSCKYDINLGGIEGSGNSITETRPITESFDKIAVSQGIQVLVEQSDNKSVRVATDDNLQEHIITKVENGVLIIEADTGYDATESPVVTVKMPVISGLKSSSGASIKSTNTLITTSINVKSSSGSEIEIAVEADAISLETSSGSNIVARGKALKLETSSSSGSEINAEKLLANDVIAQATSGSNTDVSPILSLDGKASSGSSIDYHKTPKNIKKEESSGGSVTKQ
ncbi:MAG TPA: head GIN domain-containing protein [Flavobacterium sp.]|jgi:hypothetical protein